MKFRTCTFFIILLCCSLFPFSSHAQQIVLTTPANQVTLPATIDLNADVTDVLYPQPAYMEVQNSLTGYRKLKFGYNSQSIYSPLMNVIEGGNTHLQITMRILSPAVDWNKIMIKPMGLGNLILQPYILAGGIISDDWFTINIPLSDFSSTINFTQIANIEFPYSANAPPFNIAISTMKFTGGTSPFLWFGEGKTDNKHNGNGGSGELSAHVVPGSFPSVYPAKVVFSHDDVILGEDSYPPYQYSWVNPDQGNYEVRASLYMSDNQIIDAVPVSVEVLSPPPPPFSVALDMIPAADSLLFPANIQMTATVEGLTPPPPDHLLVTNSFTGYRKLKLGYSATSIYSPMVNVVAGGNTNMEIVLFDAAGGADWSKIQIRPGGIGTLSLLPYVNAAGGVGSNWTTINIPLADFSSAINFSAIANIEFPYSASSPYFQLAIKSIRFTGGTTPFVWFGFGKTDNKHNGNGGSGELYATIFLGQQSGDHIEKVQLFSADTLIQEDTDVPFTFNFTGLPVGNYSFSAKVFSHQGLTATSASLDLTVYEPPQMPSTMTVAISNPIPGTNWLAPLNLPVACSTTGAILPAPDYLKVVNTLTGFRKLKFGYSPASIYLPKQDVKAGGNDTLEIVLRNMGGTLDWSKIRIRPEGLGLLNLGPYVTAVGGVGQEWKTIRIPLSHFDTAIHFNAIGHMEFPYSAGANSFTIGIQSIRFTGGTTPFVWFGYGKTNNAHDGDGGTGRMTASIISPNALAVDVARMSLYDNGTLVYQDSIAPFNPVLQNPAAGSHLLRVKMIDTKGGVAFSQFVNINVVNTLPEGNLLITLNLNQTPSFLNFKKAALRYDKDFAYSFSMDDGLVDAYTCGYKLLNGGYSTQTLETYPGLHFTDGCGNPVAFKGSLNWNSVSSSFGEIHVNTPSYVSWPQLNEMLDNGWAVVNHSYSHATDPATTNFPYQITANDSAVFNRTGRHMNHFVIPGGNNGVGYSPLMWEKGIVCNYNRTTAMGNPYGLQVGNPLNYYQFSIYRDYKCDDTHNSQNIFTGITNCALQSQNGNHLWYNDFTHHVSPTQVSGSLLFPLFRYYLEQIEALYGQPGSDRIWAASGVEVFEYLKLRDSSSVTCSWWGNQIRIMVDRNNIPDDLWKYAMSFTLETDADITSIETSDPGVNFSFRGNTSRKLVNIEWSAAGNQAFSPNAGSALGSPGFTVSDNEDLKIHQVDGSASMVIHCGADESVAGLVQVYDRLGNIVYTTRITNSSPTRIERFNMPGLAEGIYLVKLTTTDGRILTGRYCQPQ